MTYDARHAAFREQKAWAKACEEALCSAYSSCCGVTGVHSGPPRLEEACNHPWCHGIVDVLNRAYCNPHTSYRMPEVNDKAKGRP